VSDRWLDAVRRDFADRDESDGAQGACPTPDAIWAAVHAAAPSREARAIVEHLATCPSCAADWRLAMRSPERPRAAEPAKADRPGWMRFPQLVPLAAAAAVLLAMIGLWLVPGPEQAPPDYRQPERAELESLIADGAVLEISSFALRWSPGPAGSRYAVRVSDRRLRRLAGAEALLEPSYRVPPDALSGLACGDLVLWQVEVVLPDGRRFVSETFTARLK